MIGETCKYIGCTNMAQSQCRACTRCHKKYAGIEKPPVREFPNKWRAPLGKYKNIEAPPKDEDEMTFVRYISKRDYKKIISEARSNQPQQQFFNENLNYTPFTDDGFKTYNRFTELDTVGKIKFPWDR